MAGGRSGHSLQLQKLAQQQQQQQLPLLEATSVHSGVQLLATYLAAAVHDYEHK